MITRVTTSNSHIDTLFLNSHASEFIIQDDHKAVIDLTDYTVTLLLTSAAGVIEMGAGTGFDVANAALGKTILHWDAGSSPPKGTYTGQVVLTAPGFRNTSLQFPKLIIR